MHNIYFQSTDINRTHISCRAFSSPRDFFFVRDSLQCHSCFATTLHCFAFFRLSTKVRVVFFYINIYSKPNSTERIPFMSLACFVSWYCGCLLTECWDKKETILNKPEPELSGFHTLNTRCMLWRFRKCTALSRGL